MKKLWSIVQLSSLLLACLVSPTGAQAATYVNSSTAFSWIDPSTHTKVGYNTAPYKFNATGCGTTPPILDDTISDLLPIGFNFTYGVTVYTQVRIQTNGRLQFGNATCGSGTQNVGPPQTYPYVYPNANMTNTMKIFGVDLDPTNLVDKPNYPTAANKTTCLNTASCYISFATIGVAPNRQFVVTWKGVPEWVTASNTSGTFDLQVILNEDGTFVYQYGAITHGGTGTAQVGWELTTTDYQVLSFGASVEPAANSAVKFFKPLPVAQYQFEEGAWAPGLAGQVADVSGNNRSGMALNKAQETASGYVCRGANIPANTSSTTVDAIKTGVSFKDASVSMLGTGTATFWYNSALPWTGATAQSGQLLDATATNGQWFYLTKTASGTLYFQITDSTGAVFSVETPVQAIAANTWTHIAITWNLNGLAGANQDKLNIYVNAGAPTTAAFTSNGAINSTVDYIYLGDNPSGYTGTKGTVNSAGGVIDEARFYNYEMLQAEVAVVKAASHGCSTFIIDHLEISHANWNGIVCEPGTVTITACQNASCSTLYTSGLVATMTASGAATSWLPSGDNTAVIGVGQTSVTKQFYTATGTATLGATALPAPTNVSTCKKSGVASACTWNSQASGLVVTPPAVLIGGQPTNVTVQAVQSTSGSPLVPCSPITGLANKGLKLWSTPISPVSFPATSVSAGVTVGGVPLALDVTSSTYVNVPTSLPGADNVTGLTFDATAKATVSIKHMDVGNWTLNAQLDNTGIAAYPTLIGSAGIKTIPVGYGVAATDLATSASMAASNATQTACGAQSLACDVAAGAEAKRGIVGMGFSNKITAALWTSTTTSATDLSINPVAPSYTGAVTLSNVLLAPLGGAAGSLGTSSVNLASGSYTIANQTWSQIGATRIDAAGTYLANNITGKSQVLSRFVPHHFTTAVTAACNSGGFTYSQQPIGAVLVTAVNASGVTLTNYTRNFARDVTLSDGTLPTSNGTMSSNTIAAALFSTVSPPDTGPGVAKGSPVFSFNTIPTLPTTIILRATDGEVSSSVTVPVSEGTAQIRSGRLWLNNAYGSELMALPVPVQTQYWSATGWVRNSSDSCTLLYIPTVANGGLTNTLATKVSGKMGAVTVGSAAVAAGDARLVLSAPTLGATGLVDVNAGSLLNNVTTVCPVPATGAAAWLPPATCFARACYGVCGPRSPVIYLRERF